jgi:drug/metabolite transporter (DMT)-like permease
MGASLFAQITRRRVAAQEKTSPALAIAAGILFVVALGIVPLLWGQNSLAAWMLFLAPLLAGGAGSAIRATMDRAKGTAGISQTVLGIVVLGMIAGGISTLLFVMAQLSANPTGAPELLNYSRRSILFAVGIGFVAGLTSDAVFAKLVGLDVVRTEGVTAKR